MDKLYLPAISVNPSESWGTCLGTNYEPFSFWKKPKTPLNLPAYLRTVTPPPRIMYKGGSESILNEKINNFKKKEFPPRPRSTTSQKNAIIGNGFGDTNVVVQGSKEKVSCRTVPTHRVIRSKSCQRPKGEVNTEQLKRSRSSRKKEEECLLAAKRENDDMPGANRASLLRILLIREKEKLAAQKVNSKETRKCERLKKPFEERSNKTLTAREDQLQSDKYRKKLERQAKLLVKSWIKEIHSPKPVTRVCLTSRAPKSARDIRRSLIEEIMAGINKSKLNKNNRVVSR